MMSFDDLLAEASKLRGWKVVGGAIRRFGAEGRYLQCPITAVARAVTGKIYFLSEFYKAGAAIGLDRPTIRQIVAAADGYENASSEIRRELLARLDPKLGDAARWSRR
jgi:hypothetical protein